MLPDPYWNTVLTIICTTHYGLTKVNASFLEFHLFKKRDVSLFPKGCRKKGLGVMRLFEKLGGSVAAIPPDSLQKLSKTYTAFTFNKLEKLSSCW